MKDVDIPSVAVAVSVGSAHNQVFTPVIAKYPCLADYQLIRLMLFVKYLRSIGKPCNYNSICLYICRYDSRADYFGHVATLEDNMLFTVVRAGRVLRSIYLTRLGHEVVRGLDKCYLEFTKYTQDRTHRKPTRKRGKRAKNRR